MGINRAQKAANRISGSNVSGSDRNASLRLMEWLAAVTGAIICVVVPLLFAQRQGWDFPFPGLYFIEIALCGVLVMTYVALRLRLLPAWGIVPWTAAGIILAFVILGGFSIGPFLIPALIGFLAGGVLGDLQSGTPLAQRLGIFLVAAVVQGASMLLATLIF